jgi:multiple sugar transport system substrate-binding protein
MTSKDRQSEDVVKFSDASPLKAVYEDPAVQKAQPFADELKTAVENSLSRPVSPVYPQISQAIYKNVNQALAGQMSPEEALKNAQSEMDRALQTF